jgi:predicted nucleotide-binding protein
MEEQLAAHKSAKSFGRLQVSEAPLNELLEDLTDYSAAHGDEHLFKKLTSLKTDGSNNYLYTDERDFPEAMARISRVIRALETFGHSAIQNENALLELHRASQSTVKLEPKTKKLQPQKVFVVHGHDNAVLFRVKETLQVLGLQPIVLREQPNNGRTIIEKFETYSDVAFAVVLMTADDMGGSLKEIESGSSLPRARQNVVMELGFFASKLGRSGICVLKDDAVQVPSDIMGVVYTPIDQNEAWRLNLAKELRGAGYDIDLNAL